VHHVADVEVEYPVVVLFDPEVVSDRNLEILPLLKLFDFLHAVETDVELLTLSHEVVLTVPLVQADVSLLCSLLLGREFLELVDDRSQLGQDGVRVSDDLRNHLDLLLDVVYLGSLLLSYWFVFGAFFFWGFGTKFFVNIFESKGVDLLERLLTHLAVLFDTQSASLRHL
jgi:hypothetical protein